MTSFKFRPTGAFVALAVIAFACFGTETDNPVAGSTPPAHESPPNFEPVQPDPPGCIPDDADAPPRDLPLWAVAGNLLVGLDGGLVVVDVSEPSAPTLVARHALHGEPRQLLAEGTDVTLVIDELPMFDAPSVPAPAALEPVTRLVRFDISDPTAPVRVSDVALDGEFWQLVPRAGSYWVMSARIVPEPPRCDIDPHRCNYVQREALVLQRFGTPGDTFVAQERVELPMTNRAVSTEHGFAAATQTEEGGVLHIARFTADGSLAPTQSLTFEGQLTHRAPIHIGPERIAFLAGGLWVGPASGDPTPSVTSMDASSGAVFTDRGVFVPNGEQTSVTFVDWTDLGALQTTVLPGIQHVLPLPNPGGGASVRALAWREGAATSTFSLLSLEGPVPAIVDTTETEFKPDSGEVESWLEGSSIYLSGYIADPGRGIGGVSYAGDMLTIEAPFFEQYTSEVVSAGGWVFSAGLGALEARELGDSGTALLELDRGEVLDVAVTADAEATLLRGFDGQMHLEVTRGSATERLDVSPAAERVLGAGDRWLVLSGMPVAQCEQGGGDCEGYGPNVAVVAGDPPSVVAELPLPSVAPALGPLSSTEERWAARPEYGAAPIDLGDGRWLLTRELSATCQTEADCEALGIDFVPISEANVNTGAPADCPPNGAAPCEMTPRPEPTVYGTTTRRSYFVLDAASATFSEAVDIDTQGDMYWSATPWSGPRLSRDTILDSRIEVLERRGGTPINVRVWLERLNPQTDGSLQREASLSIPGYPIGLIDATTLLTAQPEAGATGRALLHRVNLNEDHADIDATLTLEARYGDVRLVGDHAVYLRMPTSSCEPEMTLEAVAVAGATLENDDNPAARLVIPGIDWRIIATEGDHLLLSDASSRAFARVRVSESGELSLEAFATAPTYVAGPSWQGGKLYGASRHGTIRLAL